MPGSPRPHLCGRQDGSVTMCCCSDSKPFPPLSLKQWQFWQSLSRKISLYAFVFHEERAYNVSAISSIFNHQLSDKCWDIMLFLVWRPAVLAVVLEYIIPNSAEAVMIYWLTLSISLTLGRSIRSKRKLRIAELISEGNIYDTLIQDYIFLKMILLFLYNYIQT